MAHRMFGIETEYSFSAFDGEGARVPANTAVSRFYEVVRDRLPHLEGQQTGVFLANGSRLYIDQGVHPELSTCEVVDPWDAVRYVRAGDRMLASVTKELASEGKIVAKTILSRSNVSYVPGCQNTWGCHESYGHRAHHTDLSSELIPHLVSRIVYTGEGGFDSHHPGLVFMLSPRVAYLTRVVSGDSTSHRGIYHTKDESLSNSGFRRLHVICGGSVCSDKALWLKVAITALVVAMIEADLHPCQEIRLADPLAAMHRFARDETLQAPALSLSGRYWTALAMQRHILEQLEAHQDHPIMPEWAPRACAELRSVLDRLEAGIGRVERTLDWAIKLSLYRELLKRRGIAWDTLSLWNDVLAILVRGAGWHNAHRCNGLAILDLITSPGRVGEAVERLTPAVEERGLTWDDLGKVLSIRDEVFELDTRFSEIGEQGIFESLARRGILDCTLGDDRDIDERHVVGRADRAGCGSVPCPRLGSGSSQWHGAPRLA